MQFIPFKEEISRRSVERLILNLKRAGAPNGVYLSSPGGTFEHFSILGPSLERRGILTLSGNVRSAAIILSLLGHRRHALPDATFFFHEVRVLVGPNSEITISELEEVDEYEKEMEDIMKEGFQEWKRQMSNAQNWFLHFISQRTGLSVPTFLNLMRNEVTLSAKEAIRYGIVQEIHPLEHYMSK